MAACILAGEFGMPIVSLMGKAKEMYAHENDLDQSILYDRKKKEPYIPHFLLWVEEATKENSDLFFRLWCDAAYCMDSVICDDMRLVQQYEGFGVIKAKRIRITASSDVRKALGWCPNPVVDTHLTEVGLDHIPDSGFDLVIQNSGPGHREEFEENLISNVKVLLGKPQD